MTTRSLDARPGGDLSVDGVGPQGHEVQQTFPSAIESVAAARHFARDVCERWQIASARDVEICVSEVVANAVTHGEGEVGVELVRTPWGVRVAVSDGARELPVVRPPTRDGEGGRGMAVVSALAVRWAARPTDHGKVVWFHVSERGD
ncbi:MAG TPA: ATP-binding protein [Mycobacteriales bacterium]|nr:ATP-binding protein [Mycobacteriales bacterium]